MVNVEYGQRQDWDMKRIENTAITYYKIGQTLKFSSRPPFTVIGFVKCTAKKDLRICPSCSGHFIVPDRPDEINARWHDVRGDFIIL